MKKLILIIAPFLSITLNSFPQSCDPTIDPCAINASISYNNSIASGTYKIYKNTQTGVFQKPIIIIEGWDPLNTIDEEYIYTNILNTSESLELPDKLRELGYDIVILNFDDGADYIQKNAFLLVKLIQEINKLKGANGEPNVVVGVSMGGLVARYALRYMEKNNLNHDTRLYVSYDSPQQGANEALGAQQFIVHHAQFFPYLAIDLAEKLLIRPASKQMLNYWIGPASSHIDATSTANPNPLRNTFYNELNQLLYPQQCRNIAIANGNKKGLQQKKEDNTLLNPGEDFLYFDFTSGNNSFKRWARVGNPTSTFDVLKIKNTFGKFIVDRHYTYNPIKPYDYAPGSKDPVLQNIASYTDGIIQFSAIPAFVNTVSALDINTTDLFYNIDADEKIMCRTPFSAFYAPLIDNQVHTDLPTETANWLFDQIVGGGWNINDNLTSFNFGNNTNDIIFQNTVVTGTGKLKINSADRTDYYNKNYNPSLGNFQQLPFTNTNSSFEVKTPGCWSNITVETNNGGEIIIGDDVGRAGILKINSDDVLKIENGGQLIVNSNSQLIIESGAVMIIKNKGQLIVKNNGLVKIEPGAKLIYEEGAEIQLLGDNAVLEIQGTLEIGANATFTFTFPNSNSGYVKFNMPTPTPWALTKNITAGTGAKMVFIGTDQDDKVLEVTQEGMYPPDNIISFIVQKGTITLGPDARVVPTGVNTFINFTDAKVTSTSGTNNAHRGLTIFGQKNVTIDGCVFENGTYGIYAFLTYSGNPLRIELYSLNLNYLSITYFDI